jgi:hypothetical protein
MSAPWIDGGLYPDMAPPQTLDTFAERVDFIARLCAAWDFGRLPDVVVVNEVRKETWCDAVDACRLLTSPTYHLLRRWHGLPVLPYLGQKVAYIRDDPSLAYV